MIADNSSSSASATGTGAITLTQSGAVLQIGNNSATGYIANLPISNNNGIVDFARTDSRHVPEFDQRHGRHQSQDGGVITLTGTNTYSGITNTTNATLVAGSTSAFGNGLSALSLGSAGSINLSQFQQRRGFSKRRSRQHHPPWLGHPHDRGRRPDEHLRRRDRKERWLECVRPEHVRPHGRQCLLPGPTTISAGADLLLGFGGSTGSIASSGVSGAGTLEFDLSVANSFAAP